MLRYFKRVELSKLDLIWFYIFALFFAILINISLENYYPNWDSFTHWAIDTRYIFVNSALRDNSYNLLAHGYLPFYPLQLNYVYVLYGKIVEQYSGLLTLYYGILGVGYLVSHILEVRQDNIKKSIIYLATFIGLYMFYLTQGIIFSQYSDVSLSVFTLIYLGILFKGSRDENIYWQRILMIFFIAIAFYLTKTHYSIISALLIILFCIFDFKFILKNCKSLLFNVKNIFVFVTIIIFSSIVYKYGRTFALEEGIVSYALKGFDFMIKERIIYIFDMLAFLFNNATMFVSILITSFSVWLLHRRDSKSDIIKILSVVLIAITPLTFFIITMSNLHDMSILRYLGLIFFGVPFLFLQIWPKIKILEKWRYSLFLILTLFISLSLITKIIIQQGIDLSFNVHSGSYKDFVWHKDFYQLSKRIEEKVPAGSKIMLVDQEGDLIGNMDLSIIIIRYYLADYNAGGQYRFNAEQWYEYFAKVDPDYLFVYTYDGFWEGCNTILENQKSYLIKIEDSNIVDTSSCFLKTAEIVSL